MPSGHASRMMPTIRRVVLAGAVADRTDGQLLAAFVANRDADAFAGLVRRHGPMVLGVCRRVTGDHHTAEDAFQAVFLVLARRAAAVRPREQVGNWLYGVAYRTALKARAVLARRRSREKQVDVMPEPLDTRRLTPPGSPDWSDLQPVIDEELARLPEKLRAPVVLCDLEGRPQRDVARHLGLPPATLATRLASARRTLAARLTKRGVTLSGGALAGLLSVHGTAAAVPHTLTHGITRAVEAATTGAVASGLVSTQAVQLSEGVMRMMMLAKLKAVTVVTLTAVALTGGLGLGLVPAYAGGGGDPAAAPAKQEATRPAPGQPPANPIDKVAAEKWWELKLNINEPVDDPTFLRRLCLDLCGVQPTPLELFYFVKDEDDAKRSKVVTWLVDDNADVRAHAAKRLGVPIERVRLARVVGGGDGKPRTIVIVVEVAEPKMQALAFSPDGKRLAVESKDVLYSLHRRVRPAAQPPAGSNDSLWIDVGDSFLRPKGNEVQARDAVWLFSAADDKTVRLWDTATGKAIVDFDNDGKPDLWAEIVNFVDVTDSDAEFLKRVLKDARGTAPTALEEKYFAEDKDPKKREKLLDTLLKDPAVAKKLGDEWKKKMLAAPAQTSWAKPQVFEWKYHTVTPELYIAPGNQWVVPNFTPYTIDNLTPYNLNITPNNFYVTPNTTWQWNLVTPENKPTPPQADKFEKLVDELLAAKKSDAEMLEAITLAAAGRLPTEAEKKLTLGLVGKAADRKAAWLEVAKALAPPAKK